MKQDAIRYSLIDGTIHVIARDGLDKATTKQIGKETQLNEVYIYRNFKDKEDLFAKTFDLLDEELLTKVMQHFEIMFVQELDFITRCRLFFFSVWKFVISGRDKCLTYVRYFYSPYFIKNSADTHKKRFAPLVKEFRPAFKEEANVWMILNHMLNVLLDFAVKVHSGQMPEDDDYAEHIFRVIYASVKQYFKNNEEKDF